MKRREFITLVGGAACRSRRAGSKASARGAIGVPGKIGFVPLRSNSRNVGGTSVRNCAEYGHRVAMIWRASVG